MNPIYLDYNATTPVDEEVALEMRPYLEGYFGNPSSSHIFGVQAKKAVEKARKQVAELLNCKPHEIIFTSGGTESNNYAIKGIAYTMQSKGNHIITSAIEHPAVSEVCKYLEKRGFEISYISVDEFGIVNMDELKQVISPQTILISIMHANNEVGSIQPIQEIAELSKEQGIILHTDAAQSLAKVPVNVVDMGVELLSIAGHKIYAPKGIGALFIKEGVVLEKLIHGADHEQDMRAGTENVLEIVGLGKACEIAKRDLTKNMQHLQRMRDLLHNGLMKELANIKLNGHPDKRLPNTLNVSFQNVEANTLLSEITGIAASAGAACHSYGIEISTVLSAMNVPESYAMGAIRFSTGKQTKEQEINEAIQLILQSIKKFSQKADNEVRSVNLDNHEVKLTQFTHGLGCACKLDPKILEKVLEGVPVFKDSNILIGNETSDDAAVYQINDSTAIVQTIDFFTPIVDSPYDFGAIAAANALSDIYAMGAKPLFGLNIVCFPSNRLPIEVLQQILKGATEKAREAGINIVGGHTIEDTEPKYGMVVTGIISPDKILKNSGAQPNDSIILTKPIGVGIISTAIKRGLAESETQRKVTRLMSELNKTAAMTMTDFPVSACTDVTGFGLLGHLGEMTKSGKIDAEIYSDNIPVIDEAWGFATANVIPGGTQNNLEYVKEFVKWHSDIAKTSKIILCDAQTSGGLLIAVPQEFSDLLVNKLRDAGLSDSACIGRFTKKGKGEIIVRKTSSS